MKKEYRGFKVVSHIAILFLVLLIAVSTTFSWYDRSKSDDVSSYRLDYSQTGKVNGAGEKTVKTYAGTNSNGIVTYSETELADSREFDVVSGEATYFKTVITETDNAGDSVVSLYLDNLTCTSGTLKVGIVGPEKTYIEHEDTDSTFENLCIEDNLIVKSQGTVEIYWFVIADADGTIELGNFYIVHN